MRKLKNVKYETEINVVEFAMTKNMWEYFITDDVWEENSDIVRCLVMGFETELGDVSLNEIKPYVITRSKDLSEVMPPKGWEWV